MLDHEGFRTAGVTDDDDAASPDAAEPYRWSDKQRPMHLRRSVHLPPSAQDLGDYVMLNTCMVCGCSVDLTDILDVKPCLDPSLPEGHAFWLALHSQPQGLFFISGMAACLCGCLQAC